MHVVVEKGEQAYGCHKQRFVRPVERRVDEDGFWITRRVAHFARAVFAEVPGLRWPWERSALISARMRSKSASISGGSGYFAAISDAVCRFPIYGIFRRRRFGFASAINKGYLGLSPQVRLLDPVRRQQRLRR